MKQKNIPQRMCIVCREMKDKNQMLRIVCNSENNIFVDTTGKAQGRGAYICQNVDCFNKCSKAKLLNKAFKQNIDENIYKNISEAMIAKRQD